MVESDFNYRKYHNIEMRRKDPYGFWYIELPELAAQSFTSVRSAYQAIDEYLFKKTKKVEKPKK